mmetsp:Transcript_3014/g.9234  ORF Transcript_3014/g.9234 Transcript_3014/m.9234 type:complete len:415 (+) Transcript_3014:179-1423(+)
MGEQKSKSLTARQARRAANAAKNIALRSRVVKFLRKKNNAEPAEDEPLKWSNDPVDEGELPPLGYRCQDRENRGDNNTSPRTLSWVGQLPRLRDNSQNLWARTASLQSVFARQKSRDFSYEHISTSEDEPSRKFSGLRRKLRDRDDEEALVGTPVSVAVSTVCESSEETSSWNTTSVTTSVAASEFKDMKTLEAQQRFASMRSSSWMRSESTAFRYFKKADSRRAPTSRSFQSKILEELHFQLILDSVPKRLQRANFDLLYSSAEHGRDLRTLYKKVGKKAQTVFVVRDVEGHVFGGYASNAWHSNLHFYGNSECFLFKLAPTVEFYPASKRNEFFQFSNGNSLAMGGGEDCGFGLYVHCGLRKGSSNPCVTFNSEGLSGSNEFDIDTLEVWNLLPRPDKDADRIDCHESVMNI